jgi:hypothetical protein
MAPLRTSTPDSAVEYTRSCRPGAAEVYALSVLGATLSFATARHGTRGRETTAPSPLGVRVGDEEAYPTD